MNRSARARSASFSPSSGIGSPNGADPLTPARWIPTTCAASTIGRIPATPDPASVPCAAYRSYPSRLISSAHICATPKRLNPPSPIGFENPYPGSDGTTT